MSEPLLYEEFVMTPLPGMTHLSLGDAGILMRWNEEVGIGRVTRTPRDPLTWEYGLGVTSFYLLGAPGEYGSVAELYVAYMARRFPAEARAVALREGFEARVRELLEET